MTPKSVLRRGALVTVATASAVALTACGAGQISQTANQVAAVDGAQNPQESNPGGVAIRDAHILVNPEDGKAALKFSAINQERANDATYTLKKVEIDGIGEANLTKDGESETYKKLAKGDKEIPRNCSLIADSQDSIKMMSEGVEKNAACVVYMSNDLDAEKLVNDTMSASGENRNVTFTFDGPKGEEKIELFVTVSAEIAEAGQMDRNDDGMTKNEKKDAKKDDKAGEEKDAAASESESAAPEAEATPQ
ncbi:MULTISPECIES: hypothetical protein [unclassified Corynebacterium]|uniref:hypothetical protein n=1 Tax=unclassified Corynebacterium TaxID=2624378 RepID=UPI0030B23935